MIFPYHTEEERFAEAEAGGTIGTTGRGIGPCYQDKVGRRFGMRRQFDADRICDEYVA